MADSEGCSVNGFLCKPCHFHKLTTETLIYCAVMKHELQLWTLTYLWRTQKIDRANTEDKNLLFCEEQRQCICQAIMMVSENNFDSLSVRGPILVNLDYFNHFRKSVLLFLSEKRADWCSDMLHGSHQSHTFGAPSRQYPRLGLPASNTWVFSMSCFPAVQVFPPLDIHTLWWNNAQVTSQAGQNTLQSSPTQIHKSAGFLFLF